MDSLHFATDNLLWIAMSNPCLRFYLQHKLEKRTIIKPNRQTRACTTDEIQFFSNNQVQLPLTDGIGLQSTQASEALLSGLSASFDGSPPVMHICYPYHQILFDWQQNQSEQFYMQTQK
jgi:hypothetical protein